MTTADLRLNYTRDELAQAFRLSTRTIDRLRAAGLIDSYREGRTRLFPVKSVQAYLAQKMGQPADGSADPSP